MTEPVAAARLRGVMACVPSGVAIIDREGVVIEANPRWHAMWQRTALRDGERWWSVIHPDDRRLLPPVAGAPAGGGPVEVRKRLAEGEERWVSVSVEAVGDGSIAVVALTDIDGARRDAAEREALHRVADAAARGGDPGGVFAQVAREVALLIGADGGGVVQFDAAVARVVGRWSREPDLDARVADELPLTGVGATALVYASGHPARVDYAALAGPGAALDHPWRVAVAAPVRVEGRLWGAVGVIGRSEPPARDAEERLARFAEFVGMTVAGAEVRELLEQQARTDPLTGLAHHGAFHEALLDEVARARRYGHALSLAVIDLDHFKRVNDGFGHMAGDDSLRSVAELLRSHARAIDVVARVGGEEFAWLMPETTTTGATAAAERFRHGVASLALEVGALTASVGIAGAPGSRADATALFRSADRALYRAKAEGRNRTAVAPPPPPMS